MKKRTISVILSAIALLALATCAFSATWAETAREVYKNPNAGKGMYPGTSDKKSISVGITTMSVMNTIKMTYNNELGVARHCFDTLVKLDPNNVIVPAAAESWEEFDGGMRYRFKLRPAKWVDTTGKVIGDVKASDFVFAWGELLNPENACEYWTFASIFKNARAYYDYKSGKAPADAPEVKLSDVGFRAIDDQTLEIELEDYLPYLFQNLKFEVLSPICEEFYKKVGADAYGTAPDKMAYSGAFRMTEWVDEQKVVVVKNPEWWDAANVELERINFDKYTDDNTRMNAFLGGELDIIDLKGEQRQQLVAEGYDVTSFVGGYSFFFYANVLPNGADEANPNAKKSMISNANLRRAISAALDRRQLIDTVFKNDSEPAPTYALGISGVANQQFSDTVIALNGGKRLYPERSDEESAKKYLELAIKELGLKDASEIDIALMTSEGTQSELFSQVIQEQLRRVLGIEAKIDVLTITEARKRRNAKNYDLFSGGWGPDYNDPMTDLDLWMTGAGNNHTGYSNPTYDRLIESTRTNRNPILREMTFALAELLIADELPIIPTYWRHEDYAMSEKIVSGAVRCPFQFHYLTYIKLAD